jgi:D-glycero-D-manno-heptose 1,7-bisphosphate phosphatase
MRKPGAGMFLRAAREHGLDLAASWFVGDRARDVAPARALGGRAVLVRGPQTETGEGAADPFIPVVESLSAAVEVILAGGAGED